MCGLSFESTAMALAYPIPYTPESISVVVQEPPEFVE